MTNHTLTAEAKRDHMDDFGMLAQQVHCRPGISIRVYYHPGAEQDAYDALHAAYMDVCFQLGFDRGTVNKVMLWMLDKEEP